MEYTHKDIENNMGLVFTMANEMYDRLCKGSGRMMEFQDLVSEGVIGLHFALKRFDPDKGFAFSSFAMPTMRGFMLRGHRNLYKERWKAKADGVDAWTVSLFKDDSIKPILGIDDRGMSAKKAVARLDRRMFWKRVFKVLTKRQTEVAQLIVEGMPPIQVAAFLGVTKQAVHITYNNVVKQARTILTADDAIPDEAV